MMMTMTITRNIKRNKSTIIRTMTTTMMMMTTITRTSTKSIKSTMAMDI